MKDDLISCNGKLTKLDNAGLSPDFMLSANFVYQKIHTLAYEPLHAKTHIELLETSYSSLYGDKTGITAKQLADETGAMLIANRYPAASNLVTIYLLPSDIEGGEPFRLLSCEKQLLYKGYALWHATEKAVVLPYEVTFPHYKTAASLAAHSHAFVYARSKGAGIAIAENREGVLYCAGENPLFAVETGTVYTTPLSAGMCDSVERRLGIAAAERAGFRVVETAITNERLGHYQELFTVTPGGITSIGECAGNIYSHSTASNVAAKMQGMTNASI